MYKYKPIKSQAEHDKVFGSVIKTAMRVLNISEKQAKLRIDAMLKSGVLKGMGSPDDTLFQFVVDKAMRIPQIEKEGIK